MSVTIDPEKIIMEMKRKVISDYNSYITKILTDKANSDITDYGVIVKTDIIDFTNTASIQMLVAPQVDINCSPYVMLLLEDGAFETDEMDAVQLSVTIRIRFSMLMDGFDDIRALRYLRALREVFKLSRWISPFPRRIKHVQPEEYSTIEDGRSWREIGIKIVTLIP